MTLAVRRDQARAVELGPSVLVDQAELDGEPEQPGEARRVVLVVGVERRLPVGLQEVGEDRVGVQRHMTEHIVDDVRLGQVVHARPRSHRDRGRELALREEREETLRRQIARHAVARPAGVGQQVRVDLAQVRHLFAVQVDDVRALEEHIRPRTRQMLHPLLVQDAPHLVVLGGVLVPVLGDLHRIDVDLVGRELGGSVRGFLRQTRLFRVDHRGVLQSFGGFAGFHRSYSSSIGASGAASSNRAAHQAQYTRPTGFSLRFRAS